MKIRKPILGIFGGAAAVMAWENTLPQGIPWTAIPFALLAGLFIVNALKK